MTDHVEILQGDARETLKGIAAGTVHCCVTSPPYWGLRAYIDDEREIGREPTPEAHIANLVDVFREVRRTLRDDGTLWLNYGDAYNANQGAGFNAHSKTRPHLTGEGVAQKRIPNDSRNTSMPTPSGYKPKDLLSMPFRVVEALRMDGWFHRSTIIWSKKSPMPESVRGSAWRKNDQGEFVYSLSAGRPTNSHEYVFLLTKSGSYFYNQDGNRVALAESQIGRVRDDCIGGKSWRERQQHSNGGRYATRRADGGDVAASGQLSIGEGTAGISGEALPEKPEVARQNEQNVGERIAAGRNLWTVWNDLRQSNFKGSHFATMSLDLALRCVKLGTSDAGCCPTCGNQWAPVVETDRQPTRPGTNNKRAKVPGGLDIGSGSHGTIHRDGQNVGNADPERHETTTAIKEWRHTCTCPNNSGGKPTVLDCFHGSGTSGEAARECGCNYIGCELSEEYIELSRKRFDQEVLF